MEWELCKTHRYNLTQIHPKHYTLFRKPKQYFTTSTLVTLQQWQKQVMSALRYKPPIQKRNLNSYLGIQPTPKTRETNKKSKKPRVYIPSKAQIIAFPTRKRDTGENDNDNMNVDSPVKKKLRQGCLTEFLKQRVTLEQMNHPIPTIVIFLVI